MNEEIININQCGDEIVINKTSSTVVSVNGRYGAVNLSKSDVGLDNVDNVSVHTYFLPLSSSILSFLSSASANWESVYNGTNHLSSFWESVYYNVNSLSTIWNSDTDLYLLLNSLSGNWESVYNNVNSLSGNWESVYNNSNSLSGNWESVYNNVNSLSSFWESVYNNSNSLSGNWESNYNNVNLLSGNWESVYNNVNSLSSGWDSQINSSYLSVSGGVMYGPIYFGSEYGSNIQQGIYDSSRGGLSGVSLVCSVNYDFNWQAGWITALEQDRLTPRPLYVDSAAGTSLKIWDGTSFPGSGIEIKHNQIIYQDNTIQNTAFTNDYKQNLESVYNNTNSLSSNWDYAYESTKNQIAPLSGNWTSNYNGVNSLSSDWSSVYNNVNSLSGNWESVYNGTNLLSSFNESVYSNVNSLSSNWQSNYNGVNSLSSRWESNYNRTNSLSGDWSSVFNNVKSLSSFPHDHLLNSNYLYINSTDFDGSGNYTIPYGRHVRLVINSLPSDKNTNLIIPSDFTASLPATNNAWQKGDYLIINARALLSGSRTFKIIMDTPPGQGPDVELYSLTHSGPTPTTTSYFKILRKLNASDAVDNTIPEFGAGTNIMRWHDLTADILRGIPDNTFAKIIPFTGKIDVNVLPAHTHTTSEVLNLASNLASSFLPLSGGLVNGIVTYNNNVTVYGTLSASGGTYFGNTYYTTTSALSVVHYGSGDALYVGNDGSGHIASFNDMDSGVEVLHIGGLNSQYPNVGVHTSTPNQRFTVNGSISSNNIIYDGNGNSSNWNSVYNQTNSLSGDWNSVFNNVKLLSSNWDHAYDSVKNYIAPLSANWNSNYNGVNSLSSNWDYAYESTKVQIAPLSANWTSNYNGTNSLSSRWESNYNGTNSLSSRWESNYNGTNSLSSRWESNYNGTNSLSANWESASTSLSSVSANIVTYIDNNFLPLSGTTDQINNSGGSNRSFDSIVGKLFIQGHSIDYSDITITGSNDPTINGVYRVQPQTTNGYPTFKHISNNSRIDFIPTGTPIGWYLYNSSGLLHHYNSGNLSAPIGGWLNVAFVGSGTVFSSCQFTSNLNRRSLTVQGDISASRNIFSNNLYTNNLILSSGSLVSDNRFDLGVNASTRFSIISTGNIGIGTISPNESLTVSGNVSAFGNTIFESDNANPTVRITQRTSGTGHALLVEDQNNPDSSPFVINQHGVVGIGNIPTNSPTNGPRLKVSGDLEADFLNDKEPKYFPEVNKFSDNGYNRYFYSGNGGLVGFLGGADLVTQNSLVYNFSPNVITAENFDQSFSVSVNPFTVARIEYNGSFYNTSYTQNLYPTTINSNFTVFGNVSALGSHVFESNTNEPTLRITQTGNGPALLIEDSENPDSSPLFIPNNGGLITGTRALSSFIQNTFGGLPNTNVTAAFPRVQNHGLGGESGNAIFRYRDDSSLPAIFALAKGRLSSDVSPVSAVQVGDRLGKISFIGYDNQNFTESSVIETIVTDTPSLSSVKSDIRFLTTHNTVSSLSEKMRIASSGSVGIGTSTPNERLTIFGNVSSNGVVFSTSLSAASATLSQNLSVAGDIFNDGAEFINKLPVTSALTTPGSLYINNGGATGTSITCNSQQLFLMPIWVPTDCQIDQAGIFAVTNPVSVDVKICIYDARFDGKPGKRIGNVITVPTGTTSGYFGSTISPALSLKRGNYYAGVMASGGNAVLGRSIPGNLSMGSGHAIMSGIFRLLPGSLEPLGGHLITLISSGDPVDDLSSRTLDTINATGVGTNTSVRYRLSAPFVFFRLAI